MRKVEGTAEPDASPALLENVGFKLPSAKEIVPVEPFVVKIL